MDRRERDGLIELWRTQRRSREEVVERLRSLTRREQEVLTQLMLGRPVAEIAALSVVSEATVRSQVKSILAKLEVSSQLRAVGMAHQVGWQPAPSLPA
jgi:DNA-binding NarL/FixJ family response regulator